MEGLFFAGLICGRLWRGLLQGLVSAPARRGLLFCEEKWAKEFWGRICDRLAAGRTDYSFAKGSATPTGEIKLLPFAGNHSVSLAADSLSLRLGHGAALICHRHIIHYRAATSLPLTQRGACGVGRCRFVTPCAGEAVGRCAGPGMRGHKAKNPPPFAGRGKDVFCYMAMFRMPGWLSIKARISSNLISRLNLMVRP